MALFLSLTTTRSTRLLRVVPGLARCSPRSVSSSNPDLPDFKTSINVHEHKLTRPTAPPKRRPVKPRWEGLEKLGENTMGSLIPETLRQMEDDEDFKVTASKLQALGQKAMTREEKKQRQRALDNLDVPNFLQFWQQKRKEKGMPATENVLRKKNIKNMVVNIGLYCNQACSHCHVESSPRRKEVMTRETTDRCLTLLEASPGVGLLDITGGAPELCPEFRHLVTGARSLGKKVIDRCNLTSLLEPGQEDTAEFLANQGVMVVASLPCYSSKNVNIQRGKGVFAKSIQGLLKLNELGYGQSGSGLSLHLVYNPLGGYLPPPQAELQEQYKEHLMEDFGIVFNDLFTMVNMPIKRFNDFLHRRNELEGYLSMLVRNFNVGTVEEMMCRDGLTVNWDGAIHDCDFNGQLMMSMNSIGESKPGKGISIWDIDSVSQLEDHVIRIDNHCFGCSAGHGSS